MDGSKNSRDSPPNARLQEAIHKMRLSQMGRPASSSAFRSSTNNSNDNHKGEGTPVWMHTTPRKASIAQLSMQSKTLPAYLHYLSEHGVDQRFVLTAPVVTVGRMEDRDMVLQCPQISKHHASIEKTDAGYAIRDNDSFNGTLVNGERIQEPRLLQNNDVIQLGSVELVFHDLVSVTPSDWRSKAEQHPSFSSQMPSQESNNHRQSHRETISELPRRSRLSVLGKRSPNTTLTKEDTANLGLVTILPSERKYEETITVRAELKSDAVEQDFLPATEIHDAQMLREDYEKLRLAYELSKMGLSEVNDVLEKMLEMMFSVLPVDRGVVLLKDRKTGMLAINKVKLRPGKGMERREILLSSTILKRVFATKSCVITMDAFEDPNLGKAESITRGKLRSVLCVPLIAHDEVLGVLHLDSQDRLNAFAEKDLALVKAISNQTAIAIENNKLINEIEKEVTIREALGRFLAPHVVERCIERGEEPLQKGGRQTEATILFADIRGFTEMSERSSPQEVVDLLNDFFERLVRIVFKHNGILDKYIGDCLMATFGTLPDQQENAERNAVAAAMEFRVAVEEMNRERVRNGKDPISIGVGLNTGNLVAGYIGSSQRLEYTCIGDTVNTSSRICSMASQNQVLISEGTYAKVKDCVEVKSCGKRQFKGKSQEVEVFEVLRMK